MKRHAIAAALMLAFAGAAQAAVTELVIYKQQNFKGASQTVKGEVNVLEGGFADAAQSLVVKGGFWEACTGDRFKGECRAFAPGEYPSLDPMFHQRITSVRFLGNDPKIARYETRREAREDRREARQEDRREAREDRREWREARRDGVVDLYGGQDFRGRSVRIERNERDLASQNFDGRASSLVVHEGTWELCSERAFGGRCQVFQPGEYRYLAGLDDRVSSLRQIR